jgi:hypothetical protein
MRSRLRSLPAIALVSLPFLIAAACGGDKREGFGNDQQPTDPNDPGAIPGSSSGTLGGEAGAKFGPCDEAAAAKSYVGCDYWPTVTGNLVQSVFDFAVAVANVSAERVNVTVTGPGGTNQKISIEPESLGVVYLPWVPELKGNDQLGLTASVVAKGGAFHLVSDRPVVVYQFNPLEFRAAGGPPGKDWSKCVKAAASAPDCYSYTNDASLLLPSSAMTGNYRVMGSGGWTREGGGLFGLGNTQLGATLSITATADGTKVSVKLGAKAEVAAGGGIGGGRAGDTVTFTLNKGDVAQMLTKPGNAYDFSGSVVSSDKPVQLISGVPCVDMPKGVQACDHVEETIFPAETLGKRYVVMSPTGPKKNKVGQVVRLFGNEDATKLTYLPAKPTSCPDTLTAGQVADCGEVSEDFEVKGDKSFGVATFLMGGAKVDPDYNPQTPAQPQGDPSQSFAVAVEQYRSKYIFLAPTDYKASFADVIAPAGVKVRLDGQDVSAQFEPITGTAFARGRLSLGAGKNGAHVIDADQPVGLQVLGYGDNTSYQYPGGLNLEPITAPPK